MAVVNRTKRTPAITADQLRRQPNHCSVSVSHPETVLLEDIGDRQPPLKIALISAALLLAMPFVTLGQEQTPEELFLQNAPVPLAGAQNASAQNTQSNSASQGTANSQGTGEIPDLRAPDDVIVDQSFAQSGAMFNQLVDPPSAHTNSFPGWGTAYRIGHQTGRAIGRRESITHIGAMPYVAFGNTMFFAEAQAVRANGPDLLWGGMAGGGVRQYVPELDRIFGGGIFYSRDDLSGVDFQQVVVSAETMGEFFDARANIYLPQSTRTGIAAINIIQSSARFVDNILEFDRFRDIATSMKGADYEIVVPLPGPMGDDLDLRVAAGGYYFDGPEIKDVLGWKLRAEATIFDMVDLELQVSDDQTFNTSVMFGASFTFGGMPRNDRDNTQFDRMTEWGRRMQHSVAARTQVRDRALTAVNPDDNAPYFFYHVASDALPGGNGAVFSPFQTIVEAQDAIDTGADPVDHVIVHANSVFATPAVLRSGNSILGQGVGASHAYEVVGFNEFLQLPNVREGDRPTLTLTGQTVDGVTLADNSQFSGFIIDHPGLNGIVARNVSSSSNAWFNEVQNASLSGILIENSTGNFTFLDTVVQYRDDGTLTTPSTDVQGLHVTGGSPTVRFTSSTLAQNPAPGRFDYRLDNHGPIVLVEGTNGGIVNLANSTIDDQPSDIATNPTAPGGQGVQIVGTAGAPLVTNVTVDNVDIRNSTVEGINIFNTAGRISVLDTIRGVSSVTNAAGISVDIRNTQNLVSFGELRVTGGNDIGVNIYDLGGQTGVGFVRFNRGVSVTAPSGGTGSGVNIQRMTSGSVVRFSRDITVNDSLGIGFNVGGDDVGTDAARLFFPFAPNADGSSIVIGGATSIDNPVGSGIRVANDQSDIIFNNVSVTNRAAIGIEFVGQPVGAAFALPLPHGDIQVSGVTTVNNPALSVSPAIEIRNSTGQYQFGLARGTGSTNITGALTGIGGQGAGVNIVDNSDGPDATIFTDDFKVVFNDLNVTSTGGPGLFIDNDDFYDGNRAVAFPTALFPNAGPNSNAVVRVTRGALNATGAPAVQAQDSGIDITLSSVNATGGTQGILLTDTHFVRLNDINNRNFNFEISGDGVTAASGGTFQGQTVDGVLAQTTLPNRTDIYNDDQLSPRVALRFVNFAGSAAGDVDAVDVDNIQQLLVDSSNFRNWSGHSIEALDTIGVQVSNSSFDDLNLATNLASNSSTIQFFASLIPPNGQSFALTVNDSDIVDQTFHAIEVATTGAVANGAGPQLNLRIDDNRIVATNDAGNNDGLNVIWNGVLNANIINNGRSSLGAVDTAVNPLVVPQDGFVMGFNSNAAGDAGRNNGGINITTPNQDDFATIVVRNNLFVANADLNTAAIFNTQGPSFITADFNTIVFAPTQAASTIPNNQGRGFVFNMTSTERDDVIISSNRILDNTRPFVGFGVATGNVTGINFQQVTNAFIRIDDNNIQRLTGDGPITQGIIFTTASGTIQLFGDVDNTVLSGTPFAPVFNPGNYVGSVLVNGVAFPQ